MSLCLLVVDSDLGFAFWLAKILDNAGYEAFPAREIHEAFVLLREMPSLESNLRMIIVNSDQPSAEKLVSYCRRHGQPDLVVIWLLDNGDVPVEETATRDVQRRKPADATTPECKELLVTIGRLLASRRTGSYPT